MKTAHRLLAAGILVAAALAVIGAVGTARYQNAAAAAAKAYARAHPTPSPTPTRPLSLDERVILTAKDGCNFSSNNHQYGLVRYHKGDDFASDGSIVIYCGILDHTTTPDGRKVLYFDSAEKYTVYIQVQNIP